MKCPGCPELIEADDVCCDRCWRRAPIGMRAGFRIKHTKSNWPVYLKAAESIVAWLREHPL